MTRHLLHRLVAWFLDRVDQALCGWANTTGDTDD